MDASKCSSNNMWGRFRPDHSATTNRCGSLTGNERSITAFTNVKIAVFAPVPSASVSTTTTVNPGDLRS